MAHPLGYSLLEETQTNKVSSRNKTIRKKRSGDVNSKKVTQFLNFMKDSNDTDITGKGANSNIHEASLADYDSLLPKMTNMPEDKKDVGYPNKKNKVSAFDEDEDDDVEITNEGFDLLNSAEADSSNSASTADYYKQYVAPQMNNLDSTNSQYIASYSNMTNIPAISANSDPNSLMKKLNYMIHMLEEQQDEKTENVTEELVLYLFLGVFVIFVCDSFARAGKYTR